MLNDFIKDYRKVVRNKNTIIYVLGVVSIVSSLVLFVMKQFIISIIVPYAYLIGCLIYLFVKYLKSKGSKDYFYERKKVKKECLMNLLKKYNINNIELFYQRIIGQISRKTSSKFSFASGLGLFLTFAMYLYDINNGLDVEKFANTIFFVILYLSIFTVVYVLYDLIKLINDKETTINEISDLLFEIIMGKSVCTSEYRTNFIHKAIMGRDVKLNDTKSVIDCCVNLAYRDMLSAGKYYLKFIDNYDPKKVLEKFKEILEKEKYIFSSQLLQEVKLFFGENELIGNGNKYITRLGITQKLINMTFKYFYCFNDYLSELEIDYSKCDCPIDSIILSSLGNKSSWSKLSIEEYKNIQKQIADLLMEKDLTVELKSIGNMAYDFLIW